MTTTNRRGPKPRLTDDAVRAACAAINSGESLAAVAERYGVSKTYLSNIWTGKARTNLGATRSAALVATCPVCAKEFTPWRLGVRYCGADCRDKASDLAKLRRTPEPPDVGTVVSCTCGVAYQKLSPTVGDAGDGARTTDHDAGTWQKVGSVKGRRSLWISILVGHRGHTLTVVPPSEPAPRSTR